MDVLESKPDDVIVIEAQGLNKETTVGFRLTSMEKYNTQNYIFSSLLFCCTEKEKEPSLLDEHQVWHLTRNQVVCGSSPGGGRIFFPFFGPLTVSLRLGYLKAISTSCWQTVSSIEVITIDVYSS